VRKIQGNYWYMLGEQQHALGDTAAALAAYQEAAGTAWDSRSMRFNVAAAFLRRGRLDTAWEHARAAAVLDPYNPKVRELQTAIRRRR
jgi:tetratricopeptide (TPR) repeat protein